nr:hypothetical protein [Tanacetum cinerariifolium]
MVIKKLKERIKSLSSNIKEDKIKKELEEIETINIELDHRVTKLMAENEHLKQTYKQLYDSIKSSRDKLMVVTPMNETKRVRFIEPVTSSGNTNLKIASSSNVVSNKPMLSSKRVNLSTSASGSQPSSNIKKDKIQQTPSSTKKNKIEAHPRTVRSSLINKNCVVKPKDTTSMLHSKLNVNSDLKCVACNGCLFSNNRDSCVLDFINNVNARVKYKSVKKTLKRNVWKPTGKVFTNIGYIWRPTSRTFTIVGNVCPLTRITTTAEVPLRKLIALESNTPKPIVTLVYLQKPKASRNSVPVSKFKHNKSLSANKKEPNKSWGSTVSNVPSSCIDECRNDHVEKIMGYDDYQIRNVMISWVYFVDGLGHNLFSVGQFSESDLEVDFHHHTCFICYLEGVDLFTESKGNNLYTLSLEDMIASSPICPLSKASKTKSWLWHQRLSHLNFGAINHLARQGVVRGLPKLKSKKDHLCSTCAMGKSKKKSHKPKSEDTNQEKLYLLHMIFVDQCVKCLRSKDEASDFIIKFLKMIQVGISHKTSVARSSQQNSIVERHNRTLIEAGRTMLIYAKALLFLWAEAVATACYTQNRSIVRLRHGKTPYELLHGKLPDLSFFYVFGTLCYPTNNSENLES